VLKAVGAFGQDRDEHAQPDAFGARLQTCCFSSASRCCFWFFFIRQIKLAGKGALRLRQKKARLLAKERNKSRSRTWPEWMKP